MVVDSILFSKVDTDVGYAIPTVHFWDLWNGPKRDLVVRLRFIPMPIGDELGAGCKWVVRLPTHVEDYVSYTPPSDTRLFGDVIHDCLEKLSGC